MGEDSAFAKKSVVAKRNRYKDQYPCKLNVKQKHPRSCMVGTV